MVAATFVPQVRRSIPRVVEVFLWIALVTACMLGVLSVTDPEARELSASAVWAVDQVLNPLVGLLLGGIGVWIADHHFSIASWLVILAGADIFALMLIGSLRSARPWQPRVRLREWMELPIAAVAPARRPVVVADPVINLNRRLAAAGAVAGAAALTGVLDASIWFRHVMLPRPAPYPRQLTPEITMSLNRNNQIVWPRRPNGIRRRASAPKVLSKGKISRPAGWVVRLVVLLVVAIPSLIITSPGYVAFADKLPDPSQVATSVPEDTLIYAADNQTLLADLHPPGYQSYFEPLSEMGTLLPEAVISIEDRNFYDEPGIDPQGIVRASVVDLQSHSTAQGASTITQQLVKLRLVGNETTLDRKMREALVAFEIERRDTKPQILEWYLNSVFFANTAWGTAAASKIYFHKQTKELDLAQASMLAGVIRGPTIYNPLVNWQPAKNRQQTVLDAMIRDGKITAADAATAFAEDLSPPSHMFTPTNQVIAPAFVSYVTGELLAQFGKEATYSGGLRVITTLNPTLQELAQEDVTAN